MIQRRKTETADSACNELNKAEKPSRPVNRDGIPPCITGGPLQERWTWVESEVWTPRMLTALEEGVKGGKWFSLIDKVYKPANLRSSFAKVKKNRGKPGVDHVTVEAFEKNLDTNLQKLEGQLREGVYRPQDVRRVYIPKPGSQEKRPLGIPVVRDRVVQGAIRHVVEPIFERDFAEGSYGFRPGRGCKDALRRVDNLLRAGFTWVVDADIKSYFDAIPHDRLMARVEEKTSDGQVLGLIRAFLQQGILDDLKRWTPDEGTPQGAVLSPLLANIYLDPLDHRMADEGFEMIRYADDFVILCRSRQDAQRALAIVTQWMTANGLRLHPDKTRIVDALEPEGGFDFLGYHFQYIKRRDHLSGQRIWDWMREPRKKSLDKLKDAIREKTRRTNGNSLETIIQSVNSTLRGWYEYFKHSIVNVLEALDKWVRMRLRSILRKRHKGKGHGYGWSQMQWPNAFFSKQGLFFTAKAQKAAYAAYLSTRQPSPR